MTHVTIDGASFSTPSGFWREAARELAGDPAWSVRQDRDVFDDLLDGGYGRHGIGEPLTIHWLLSQRSRRRLGEFFEEVVAQIGEHPHVTLSLE